MKKLATLLLIAATLSPGVNAIEIAINTQEILRAHNQWRAEVGVPPLTYSTELAQSSLAWARHLQKTNQCNMRHSKGKVGENLFWASAWSDGRVQDIAAKTVVDSWGNEKQDYSYSNNRCASGKMCGHYTQVVWKTSTMVGCGAAICDDNHHQVWVCQYSPPGNWVGQKPY